MTAPLTSNLAAYDAALAIARNMTAEQLATVIRDEHDRRGPFGRTSALLSAALDVDAERTASHHAEVAAVDTATHGQDAWKRPTSGVSTDSYREHIEELAQVGGPTVGLFAGWRTGAHIEQHIERQSERLAGPVDPDDARYRVRVTTGGSEFDGHAYMLATHKLDDNGREYESPHYVRVGVIAQGADAVATRSRSVTFHGRTMANWDATLAASDDAVMSGRQSDGTTAARHAARALDRWTDIERGTNGTHNGRPVRWQNLRAAGAVWLHAVAGTKCPDHIEQSDPQRIVGAIEVDPLKTRTHKFVALDVHTPRRVIGTDGRWHIEHDHSTYHRAANALDHTGRWEAPTRVLTGALAHTARPTSKRQDTRNAAKRRTTATKRRNSTRTNDAAKVARRSAGVAAAVECLALGTWPSGRADSSQVQAAAVMALSAWLVGPVQFAPVD